MIVRCLAILALLLVVGASCSGGAEPTVDLGAIGRLNASATKLTASRIFNIAVWIDKEAARGLSYPTLRRGWKIYAMRRGCQAL